MQHHIASNDTCVQAWTDLLPYCGAGKMAPERRRQPYHQKLCAAIRALTLNASGALQATWTGPLGARDPDVENLLVWDVGTALGHAGVTHFLRFERRNGPLPEPLHVLGFDAQHHVRYEVIPLDQIPSPNADLPAVAVCGSVACEVSDLGDTTNLWRKFKQALVRCDVDEWVPGSPFNVQLIISGPQNVALNVADWKRVKATVDGLISALHYYEGDQLDAVSQLIANRLSWQTPLARELLECRENAILGPWRVPHLKPTGLAWSPADHLLARAEIIRQHCNNDHWHIAGKLSLARETAELSLSEAADKLGIWPRLVVPAVDRLAAIKAGAVEPTWSNGNRSNAINGHQQMTIITQARATDIGSTYADGQRRVDLALDRHQNDVQAPPLGIRRAITLHTQLGNFEAGVRRWNAQDPRVYICPNLLDENGTKTRQADVLLRLGIMPGQDVNLQVHGNDWTIL